MTRYDSFQKANKKGADQAALINRLVCDFVVRKSPEQVFSRRGQKIFYHDVLFGVALYALSFKLFHKFQMERLSMYTKKVV